jgi:hypothetical protein
MRTTLSIDDDVMAVARAMAASQHKTIGEVISALSRAALKPDANANAGMRNGITLLPIRPGAEPATMEMVNRLRDELL